jgi:hypothetical protein
MANNFNPGFDREKAAFIALANRGEGLTPINYLYAKEASFESILSPVITGGTAELYTIYATGINSASITNTEDIITNRLKWSNPSNDYYVGFTAGNLTGNTIWRLPLQDGTDGQVLATNGNGILSFIDASGGSAPKDATYILQQPSIDLPNAQALNQLNNGLMKNNDGVIQIAIPGEDYLSTALPSGQLFIGNSSNIATAQQTITIDNLPNLGTTSINVPNPLDPINPITISGGKIWHGTDSNRPEESDALLVLEGDIALINFRFFSANFILGKGNSVLQTLMPGSQFLSNLPSGSWMQTSSAGTGAIVAATILENQLLMGGLNNVPEARQTINIANLPSLTDGRVWQGDATNRPVEVQLNLAPTDATYIIKTPNVNLPEAQVLEELGIGMAKIVAGGAFAIAIAGEDYATIQQLEEIEQQCQQYAEQAATSAEEAALSAEEAAASAAEASGSAVEATAAAAEATAAAVEASAAAVEASAAAVEASAAAVEASGSAVEATAAAAAATVSALAAGISATSASSSASDAQQSANSAANSSSNAAASASNANISADNAANSANEAQAYLNTLLNTGLTLQGDVSGGGLLSMPIVTTFKPNPVFTGNSSMTMPAGNSMQRPNALIPGMIRFNTSL